MQKPDGSQEGKETEMTIREATEARAMGYTIVVYYKNKNGVPFHKYFRTDKEAEDFYLRAVGVGSKALKRKRIV